MRRKCNCRWEGPNMLCRHEVAEISRRSVRGQDYGPVVVRKLKGPDTDEFLAFVAQWRAANGK